MPPFLLLTFLIQSLAPTTIFPNDSRAFVQAEDKNLIETVCPGHLEKGGKVECGKNCQSSSGLDMGEQIFDWTLTRVTYGHFLSAKSDDAVISTDGCEPHSENFGGSLLLTRRIEKWRMLWYKPGVETSRCHKVTLKSRREILVCMGDFGGQGNVWTELYVEDLLSPHASMMAGGWHFFQGFDNAATCGENCEQEAEPFPVRRALIDRVEFVNGAPVQNPRISVLFRFGKLAATPEKVKTCADNQISDNPQKARALIPRMHSYQAEFVFDGHDYKPLPSSAALAKRLGLQ